MADEQRNGDFIQTFSGQHFYPFDPRPEGEPVRVIHECFTPAQAERVFLELFEVYGGKR